MLVFGGYDGQILSDVIKIQFCELLILNVYVFNVRPCIILQTTQMCVTVSNIFTQQTAPY